MLDTHWQTASTTYCPTRGERPQAAGNRQLSTDPSGTITETGVILPSLHGRSQNSRLVSAIMMCAVVLGSVEFCSLSSWADEPVKSRVRWSPRLVAAHTTW